MLRKMFNDDDWCCNFYDYNKDDELVGVIDLISVMNVEDGLKDCGLTLGDIMGRGKLLKGDDLQISEKQQQELECDVARLIVNKCVINELIGILETSDTKYNTSKLVEFWKTFFSFEENSDVKFYMILVSKIHNPVLSLSNDDYNIAPVPLISLLGCEEQVYSKNNILKVGRLETKYAGYSSASFKFQPISFTKDTICVMSNGINSKIDKTGMTLMFDIIPTGWSVLDKDPNEIGHGTLKMVFTPISDNGLFATEKDISCFNKLIDSILNSYKNGAPVYNCGIPLLLQSISVHNSEKREKLLTLSSVVLISSIITRIGSLKNIKCDYSESDHSCKCDFLNPVKYSFKAF